MQISSLLDATMSRKTAERKGNSANAAGDGLFVRAGKRSLGAFASLLERLSPERKKAQGADSTLLAQRPRSAEMQRHSEETIKPKRSEVKDGSEGIAFVAGKINRDVQTQEAATSKEPIKTEQARADGPKKRVARPGEDELAAVAVNAANLKPVIAQRQSSSGEPGASEDSVGKNAREESPEKKDRAKVTVVDMRLQTRSESMEKQAKTLVSRSEGQSDASRMESPGLFNGSRTESLSDGSRGNEGAEKTQTAPRTSFSDMLAQQLGDSGNLEIVKAAQIILRDGDAGIIRLRLEPESLGSVKIELKMTENTIAGKIIVETEEAKTAFEKSMAQLNDAFTESGFESAKLEVSVGSGDQSRSGADETAGSPYFSERLRNLDEAVPLAGPVSPEKALSLVDIMV